MWICEIENPIRQVRETGRLKISARCPRAIGSSGRWKLYKEITEFGNFNIEKSKNSEVPRKILEFINLKIFEYRNQENFNFAS